MTSAFPLLPFLIFAAAAPASRPDLTGRVSREGDAPIAGATVYVYTAGPRVGTSPFCPSCYPDCGKRAETDAEGKYRIASLDPELVFRILFVAEGYEPTFVGHIEPESGPLDVALARVDPNRLKPEHVLRGKIADPAGRPVVGATVEPFTMKVPNGHMYGTLKGIDPLAITNLKGEFAITSEKPGVELGFKVEARDLARKNFAYFPANETVHELALDVGASVAGRLLKDGEPLVGVLIGLAQADRSAGTFIGAYTIGTDKEGRFLFSNVKADDLYYVYGEMASFPDGAGLAVREVKVGKIGSTSDVGDLAADAAHRLAGRAVLSDGKPVPAGTRILVSREQAWDTLRIDLDPEGQFEARALPTESYELHLRVRGYHLSAVIQDPFRFHSDRFSPGMDHFEGTVSRDVTDLQIVLDPD